MKTSEHSLGSQMKLSLESDEFLFLLLGFVFAYGGWPCESTTPGVIWGAEASGSLHSETAYSNTFWFKDLCLISNTFELITKPSIPF